MDLNIVTQLAGKKILITGGAGFIGSSLANTLIELSVDIEVTIVDAMLPLYGGNLFNLEAINDKIKFIQGDIRDQKLMSDLVVGQDIIFNFAAQVSYTDSRDQPFLDLDINCLGHLNCLEAVRHFNPKARIIFSSSRMVYGKILTTPVKENHPTEPLSIYGIHKLSGEKYYNYYNRTFGLDTVVTRIPNPYGPRQQMKHSKYSIVGWFIRQAMVGETIKIFGDGKQGRDYLYIDDIAQAFLALMVNGRSGEVYNLGISERVRFIDMAEAVISEVGSGQIELVPWPENYKKNETGDYVADITKMGTDTGWVANTLLKEGIKKTVNYYRQNRQFYW